MAFCKQAYLCSRKQNINNNTHNMTAKRTWAFMLTAALASASASAKWNRDSTEYDSFDRFRVGGYGELVAAFKNYGINRFNGTQQGNSHIHRGTISIPRFTIAGDYKWNRRWRLGLEIEFENGGTGTVYELPTKWYPPFSYYKKIDD